MRTHLIAAPAVIPPSRPGLSSVSPLFFAPMRPQPA